MRQKIREAQMQKMEGMEISDDSDYDDDMFHTPPNLEWSPNLEIITKPQNDHQTSNGNFWW